MQTESFREPLVTLGSLRAGEGGKTTPMFRRGNHKAPMCTTPACGCRWAPRRCPASLLQLTPLTPKRVGQKVGFGQDAYIRLYGNECLLVTSAEEIPFGFRTLRGDVRKENVHGAAGALHPRTFPRESPSGIKESRPPAAGRRPRGRGARGLQDSPLIHKWGGVGMRTGSAHNILARDAHGQAL
jgi:hypothetical protein